MSGLYNIRHLLKLTIPLRQWYGRAVISAASVFFFVLFLFCFFFFVLFFVCLFVCFFYTRVRIFHSTETVRLFRLFKRPRYVHSQVSKVKLVCWCTHSCHFKSNNMDKTIIQILHLSWNRVYFEHFETIIINMRNINVRTMPTSTKPGSSSMYH